MYRFSIVSYSQFTSFLKLVKIRFGMRLYNYCMQWYNNIYWKEDCVTFYLILVKNSYALYITFYTALFLNKLYRYKVRSTTLYSSCAFWRLCIRASLRYHPYLKDFKIGECEKGVNAENISFITLRINSRLSLIDFTVCLFGNTALIVINENELLRTLI